MADYFDVVVIGSGAAASQIAQNCRAAGKSVAVVDSKPLGGTCALRGCDPKKVLVGAADAVDWAARMKGRGVAGDARIEWRDLMAFKHTFTDPVPRQREESFAKQGIETIRGRARFLSPARIAIESREIDAGQVAIAAGRKPARLGIPGENLLIDSEQFLNLDQLPPRIIFVGGGYIAFEFAYIAARAGTKVTILHRGPRALKGFDPDLTERLVARTRQSGIDIQLNAQVTRIEADTVYAGTRGFAADLIVHAAGRVPDIEDLDLRAGNVEFSAGGIAVNEYMQSISNAMVYAAGDCADTGNPALTPVAGYEGAVAAANMLAPGSRRIEDRLVPSVAFSCPPLARVGLTEEQARTQGIGYRALTHDTSAWYTSRRIAEDCSASKVLLEEGSERIIGAHLLGAGAEEAINILCMAIQFRLRADDLRSLIFSYPTKASDISYMVHA